jgi:hypothetical protein
MRSSSLNMPMQMSHHGSSGNILTQAQYPGTFETIPSIRPSEIGIQQMQSARDLIGEFEDIQAANVFPE